MFQKIFRQIFLYAMSAACEGRLVIELPDGKRKVVGALSASTEVRIKINHEDFFKKVIRDAGVGLGESYTEGLWETCHLTPFLNFLILNKKYFEKRLRPFKGLGHFFNAALHRLRRNTLENSRKNIEKHYDLNNDFFALFLDSSMTYSCAVFERQGESLEQAQQNKIRRMIKRIEISKEDHVLEIGCGWGAFAIQAVRETGCRWTGLTLSKEQKKWADQKIAEAGLQDQIQILLTDYREAQGVYDKIVSVEMIEAVGHEYLGVYFKTCAELLKPGGQMALQAITIPGERYENYCKNCDWIQKHIFPGGHLPSFEVIQEHCDQVGLKINLVHSIDLDYATTLALWCQTLLKNKTTLLQMGYDQNFIRKWEYYFCYCEAGFRSGLINDLQIYLEKST